MHETIHNAAEKIGTSVSSVLGLNTDTAVIVGVIIVGLHLLTHEVPVITICAISLYKTIQQKKKG